MARVKKYIAKVGLDIESVKPPLRIEPGETLPDTLDAKLVDQLIREGYAEEKGKEIDVDHDRK